ncbi:hypothetical protein DESA109040_21820 [Deinococcus saxicola]
MAVYDASVLYPSLIRNLLMYLGTEGLMAARWTAAIHDEWTRNLLEDRPGLTAERLARTWEQMTVALPDAEVEGFEHLIGTLSLPDPDDRHVLAAAIHADAELIVMQNLKHFPAGELTPHGIEALTPDALLGRLLDAEPAATRTAIEEVIRIPFVSCRNRDSSDLYTPRPEPVFLPLTPFGFPGVLNTFQSESVLRASLRKPPYDTAQLLARLGAVGLAQSTGRLGEP